MGDLDGELGDSFIAQQDTPVPFELAPLVKGDIPVGFILTFRDVFPKFEATFGGRVKESGSDRALHRAALMISTARMISTFGRWQQRFRMLRKNVKRKCRRKAIRKKVSVEKIRFAERSSETDQLCAPSASEVLEPVPLGGWF